MKAYFRALQQRELRALIALAFSILGTVALTLFCVWIVWILWKGGWPISTAETRIEKIGIALVLLIVVMGVSMIGLQLAINRRQLKGSAFGASFEASGGDEVVPVAVVNTPDAPVPVTPTEEPKP